MCATKFTSGSLLLSLLLGGPAWASAPSLAVRGLVRSVEGRALAGARVELVPLASNFAWGRSVLAGRLPEPAAEAEANAAGRFTLQAPAAGLWRVVVRAPGFVPMQRFPVALADLAELPPVVLRKDAGAAVEVRDGTGRPAAGVWVYAEPAEEATRKGFALDGWRVASRFGHTDGSGRLVLPRADGERLSVSAFVAGSVAAAHSEGQEKVSLTLPAPGASRTLVVREAGAPVPGLVVTAGSPAWPVGVTGSDGRLVLGLPPSPVRLEIFAEDGRRHEVDLAGAGSGPVRIAFPQKARFAGRVVAAAGRRPVAGGVVWPGHDPGTFVISDDQGRYELPALPGERFWIQADAQGFLPQSVTVGAAELRTGRGPVLALEVAGLAAGQVVDAKGVPLAGVVVEVVPRPPTPRPAGFRTDRAAGRAVTDPAGRFSVGGLAPGGLYEITAVREGYTTARATAGAGRQAVRLVLARARSARGQVMDSAGRPVAGASVRLTASTPETGTRLRLRPAETAGPDRFSAATDGAGRFAVPEIPDTVLDVEVRREGFAPALIRGAQALRGDGPVDLGTLTLRPAVEVQGRVTGPDGRPLAGVEVWAIGDQGRASRLQAERVRREDPDGVTDAAGRFRMAELRPGQRVVLLFDRDGYLPASLPGIEAPTREQLAVVLRPASRVNGRVLDEAGEAVPGARVTLASRASAPGTVGPRREAEEVSATADGNGVFVLSEVAPGEAEVEASAEGFQPAPPLALDIPAEGVVEDVRLVLARGAVVEGRVTVRGGEPVAGARVRIAQAVAQSDADGMYRLAGALPGSQSAEVRHPEHDVLIRKLALAPGENVADFVLEGSWPVSGRVVAEGEGPLEGAALRLRRIDGRAPGEQQELSGAGGEFAFRRVPNGTYALEASREGYASEELKGVRVAGGPLEELEIALTPGALVSGRLLGLEADELAGVRVEAETRGRSLRAGRVFAGGRYEIADLGPGDWRLRAALPGSARQAEAGVTLEPGVREVSRDLEFGGLTLTGRVSHGGEPLPDTLVSIAGIDVDATRSSVTDYQGGFEVRDLRAGRYRVALTHPREVLTHTEEVELRGDREVLFDIATARVRGSVRSAAGSRPVPDALLYFHKIAGPEAVEPISLLTVGTDPAGLFTVARLESGLYRVTVRKDGYTPAERLLEVQAGADIDDLHLVLASAEGLDLVIRLASGRIPDRALVQVLDPSGRPARSEVLILAEDGYARLPTLPAGAWSLLVSAPGGVARRVAATVPGDLLQVALPEAGRLRVRVPALVGSGLTATVTLLGADGQPFAAVDPSGVLQDRWVLTGGSTLVEGLPAGPWLVRVEAADSQVWTGAATVAAGQAVEVSLP